MLYPNTVCYTEPLKAPYLLGTKHSFPVSGYEPKLSFSGSQDNFVNKHLRMKYNPCYTEKLRKKIN